MKKTQYIFIAIGLLFLAGAVFFLTQKQSGPTAPNLSVESGPIQVIVNYQKNQPFTPQEYPVTEGRKVQLKVTSDQADELHFHGYDLHLDLEAGKEGVIEFTADKTGRFDFELENLQKTLGVITVNPK